MTAAATVWVSGLPLGPASGLASGSRAALASEERLAARRQRPWAWEMPCPRVSWRLAPVARWTAWAAPKSTVPLKSAVRWPAASLESRQALTRRWGWRLPPAEAMPLVVPGSRVSRQLPGGLLGSVPAQTQSLPPVVAWPPEWGSSAATERLRRTRRRRRPPLRPTIRAVRRVERSVVEGDSLAVAHPVRSRAFPIRSNPPLQIGGHRRCPCCVGPSINAKRPPRVMDAPRMTPSLTLHAMIAGGRKIAGINAKRLS